MFKVDHLTSLIDPELRFHHIGFVVASIEASMPGFVRSLGGTWDGVIFVDPYQKVRVAFLNIHSGEASVELVEPTVDDSPVVTFLKEKGGGLHHLCYEVDDLDSCLRMLKSKGVLIAKPPRPAAAFGRRRIAWVLTHERLLIELLEAG